MIFFWNFGLKIFWNNYWAKKREGGKPQQTLLSTAKPLVISRFVRNYWVRLFFAWNAVQLIYRTFYNNSPQKLWQNIFLINTSGLLISGKLLFRKIRWSFSLIWCDCYLIFRRMRIGLWESLWRGGIPGYPLHRYTSRRGWCDGGYWGIQKYGASLCDARQYG